jgi:hypothetical protein
MNRYKKDSKSLNEYIVSPFLSSESSSQESKGIGMMYGYISVHTIKTNVPDEVLCLLFQICLLEKTVHITV